MERDVQAAVVQMSSQLDKAANLAAAERLVRAAAGAGAQLVVLPEMFNCLGGWPELRAQAEPRGGPTSALLQRLAAELSITLVGGSYCELQDDGRARNVCLTYGPQGQLLAAYAKRHLFDVQLPDGVQACESRWIAAGADLATAATAGGRLGLAICYDLRFPEHFRSLSAAGAELLAVPAAFTAATGVAHWETLLRARAIENQAYVLAANQHGRHPGAPATYGHSLILDPWGRALARQAHGEGCALARLSAAELQQIRTRLPALAHRRA